MPRFHDEESGSPATFRLGEWTVEPELDRISRGDQVVQLRPKAMEVLITLAALEGRVASKQHLIDMVWRTEFVSENALTHVIADLRTELGDSAENSTYIETIPRRGYRLIAQVTAVDAEGREGPEFDNERPVEAVPGGVTPTKESKGRRLVVTLAVVVGVIAVVLWAILGRETQPTNEANPGFESNRVVVAEFENRIGDPSFDDFGVQVADSITALLREVGRLTVATNPLRSNVSGASYEGVAEGNDPLRRLAEATRSGLVVTGACFSNGDRVEIRARIVDPWRDEIKQTFDEVDAPWSDPSPAVENLSQRVAGTLALHFENTIPLGMSRPVPLAAVQEYEGAKEYLRPSSWEAAHAGLQRALEIDPEFHLARGRLLRWYTWRGMYRETEIELEELERRLPQMTAFDRAWLGAWRAELEGRPLDVLRSLRKAVEIAPHSYWARNKTGAWAISNNRPREAVEVLTGIPFDWTTGTTPFVQRPFVNLCFAHHLLGDDEAVLGLAAESSEHFPDAMVFYGLQANVLGVMGRFEEMEEILEKSLPIRWHTRTSPGVSLAYTARELRAHGHRAQSLDLAERAVIWFNDRPGEIEREPWHYLAALNAAERWNEARDLAELMVQESSNLVQYLGLLGVLEARVGNAHEATRVSSRLFDSVEEHPVLERHLMAQRTYWRACIAAQLGESEEAMSLLQRAFSEGLLFTDEFHRDINLESLWDDPRFQELILPKG